MVDKEPKTPPLSRRLRSSTRRQHQRPASSTMGESSTGSNLQIATMPWRTNEGQSGESKKKRSEKKSKRRSSKKGRRGQRRRETTPEIFLAEENDCCCCRAERKRSLQQEFEQQPSLGSHVASAENFNRAMKASPYRTGVDEPEEDTLKQPQDEDWTSGDAKKFKDRKSTGSPASKAARTNRALKLPPKRAGSAQADEDTLLQPEADAWNKSKERKGWSSRDVCGKVIEYSVVAGVVAGIFIVAKKWGK